DHGRIQLTELTDEGAALLKACDEEVTRLEERIFGRLGEKGEERRRGLRQAAIEFDSPGTLGPAGGRRVPGLARLSRAGRGRARCPKPLPRRRGLSHLLGRVSR